MCVRRIDVHLLVIHISWIRSFTKTVYLQKCNVMMAFSFRSDKKPAIRWPITSNCKTAAALYDWLIVLHCWLIIARYTRTFADPQTVCDLTLFQLLFGSFLILFATICFSSIPLHVRLPGQPSRWPTAYAADLIQ